VALTFVLVDADFSFPAIAAFPFVWRALPRGVLLSAFFGAAAQTRRRTAKLYRITFALPLCCQVKSYRS
jgi:hypothetical protein